MHSRSQAELGRSSANQGPNLAGLLCGCSAAALRCAMLCCAALRCRAAYKMGTKRGVLIKKVLPTSLSLGALRDGDVLMTFDGVQVRC